MLANSQTNGLWESILQVFSLKYLHKCTINSNIFGRKYLGTFSGPKKVNYSVDSLQGLFLSTLIGSAFSYKDPEIGCLTSNWWRTVDQELF